MLKSIKEHEEAQHGDSEKCPYTADDVAAVENTIARYQNEMEKWGAQSHEIAEAVANERQAAWEEPLALARLLDGPLRRGGLLPTEQASWLAERQSLGPLLRHIHMRINTRGYPFAAQFHESEWERGDGGNDGEQNEADIRAEGGTDETRNALNNFDICHWNRAVAEQEFKDIRMLLRDRDKDFRAEMRAAYQDVPSVASMDHYALREKARITRNVTEADAAYRAAVRRLRALGQSVDTYDSTHVSEPTSNAGSWTFEDIRGVVAHLTPRVHA